MRDPRTSEGDTTGGPDGSSSGRMPDAYFERMWSEDDPWGFEHRWYEQRKRAVTLAALPARRARHAFEPGCAQGLLTAALADRSDRVTAVELLPAVAARARRRCADLAHVEVRVGALPDAEPDDDVDLVVASEVLYYLDATGLDRFVAGLHGWLAPGGSLVAVHWRGETNYPQSGDEVHARLAAVPWLDRVTHLEDQFLLDAWVRP